MSGDAKELFDGDASQASTRTNAATSKNVADLLDKVAAIARAQPDGFASVVDAQELHDHEPTVSVANFIYPFTKHGSTFVFVRRLNSATLSPRLHPHDVV
jgi:hypothetical protein